MKYGNPSIKSSYPPLGATNANHPPQGFFSPIQSFADTPNPSFKRTCLRHAA